MLKNEKYFDAGKLVDEVLKTEPNFSLPDNFAEMVAEKASRKFAWELYLKEFFIYLGVFVGIGTVSAAISFIWFDANLKEWLDFAVSNISIIGDIGLLALFILFADRVLLRYFMFRAEVETV